MSIDLRVTKTEKKMKDLRRLQRSEIVNRVTLRAWKDESFRDLLFENPRQALQDEFGLIPEGFDGVTFRPRAVDRAFVRKTLEGKRLVVRPKREDDLLSVVKRTVFGRLELVVVFYTKRCRYQCSFCTLPSMSAYSDVTTESIMRQFDQALTHAGAELNKLKVVSLGNEGSILDERTFSREQLAHVMKTCAKLPSVEEIVLETRGEFVSEELLDTMLGWISPCNLILKIGLESADNRIRENILRKRMDLNVFESVVEMLGRKGVGLASYVLLKADPSHSDEEGRADALNTCSYLKALCQRSGTPLIVRINTMYRAEKSSWAEWAKREGWQPPSIFDLAEVMLDVLKGGVRVFAGLYDEGLSTRDGHYEARSDFQPWAMEALDRYNQTGDVESLKQVAYYRHESRAIATSI